MLEPPDAEQEDLRLATLHNLNILDTPDEERFDRLIRIAQALFDVPVVAISLVDSDRQWFKAKLGLEVTELPRKTSFCGHTILQKNALIINDTHKDQRFADNPLVTGQPYLRFYAGQPLRASNGMMIGTLCILDYKAREFVQTDIELLNDLAIQVEMELNNPDLQRMTSRLKKSENRLLETISLLEKKEQRERSYKHCLEMVSRSDPLIATLDAIIIGVEQQTQHFLGCILTLNPESNCLKVDAAPNMPEQFIEVLNSMPLQDGLDACEACISQGDSLQSDTRSHWPKFSSMAQKSGFGGLWSQPIKDSNGEILGILLICKQEPGYPDEDDMLLIEESADLSAIALQRARTDVFIKSQAYFDPLTSLPNRNMLQDRLEHEMLKADRTNTQAAFLFIDLDHFKEINDKLGHQKGDLLLSDVAARFLKCVRTIDTVARLGGDEFTVIMGEIVDSDSVERVANNILEIIAEPFYLDGEVAYLSASIGIAFYPDNGNNMDTLIRNADHAMYEAKKKGRNRFQYFGEDMQTHALERVSLLRDLRQALSENQLRVNYQPVIDLSDGRVAKAEALLRWHHPGRGIVDPREFLPLAEETGLILEIGEWFFAEILQQLTAWHSRLANQFQLSINTSPLQFRESGRGLEDLLKKLSVMDLPTNSFGIEITECMMMEKRGEVQKLLSSIQKSNIAIALDDFGSGIAPLQKIQDFGIDYLKVDKTLIQQIGTSSKARQLCQAIIQLAHKLDIKVVAKGVETDLQRELLIDAGCDYAQGYLFSTAVSADKFPFDI